MNFLKSLFGDGLGNWSSTRVFNAIVIALVVVAQAIEGYKTGNITFSSNDLSALVVGLGSANLKTLMEAIDTFVSKPKTPETTVVVTPQTPSNP